MSSQQAVTAPVAQPARGRLRNVEVPHSAWAKARERLAWLLLTPTLLVVVGVAFYPLVETFRYSFTNAFLGGAYPSKYVGFKNYQRLFQDQLFVSSIWHTVAFTVISVAFETVLGMIIALVINSHFRGRGAVRTSMLIPWAIPTVVSASLWNWMYAQGYGVITDTLTRLHLVGSGFAPTATPSTSLAAIIAVDIWKTTPFMALLLLAGLQIIPGDLYEASTVDGASKWQQFWQMTLPMLRPALLVALIFRTLDAFRVFDVVYIMMHYAPQTLTLAVYAKQKMIDQQQLGYGSAASVFIFCCIGLLVVIYTLIVRVEEA